jgi:hypothetical protein
MDLTAKYRRHGVGLVGMSASWLKGIERGTRLPPRLPLRPNAQLSRALSNFLFKAQKELEQRGAWRPEYLTNA